MLRLTSRKTYSRSESLPRSVLRTSSSDGCSLESVSTTPRPRASRPRSHTARASPEEVRKAKEEADVIQFLNNANPARRRDIMNMIYVPRALEDSVTTNTTLPTLPSPMSIFSPRETLTRRTPQPPPPSMASSSTSVYNHVVADEEEVWSGASSQSVMVNMPPVVPPLRTQTSLQQPAEVIIHPLKFTPMWLGFPPQIGGDRGGGNNGGYYMVSVIEDKPGCQEVIVNLGGASSSTRSSVYIWDIPIDISEAHQDKGMSFVSSVVNDFNPSEVYRFEPKRAATIRRPPPHTTPRSRQYAQNPFSSNRGGGLVPKLISMASPPPTTRYTPREAKAISAGGASPPIHDRDEIFSVSLPASESNCYVVCISVPQIKREGRVLFPPKLWEINGSVLSKRPSPISPPPRESSRSLASTSHLRNTNFSSKPGMRSLLRSEQPVATQNIRPPGVTAAPNPFGGYQQPNPFGGYQPQYLGGYQPQYLGGYQNNHQHWWNPYGTIQR